MAIRVERLVRKPIVVHDFSADEGLERQGGEHVQAKEEAGNVDHQVVPREVVQHIAPGLVTECEVARQRHDQTGDQRNAGAVVCDTSEAVDGRLAEGAVDEETVVVAHECKRDDSYRLEYARVDDERATQLPSRLGWDTESLRYDSDDDDGHADQSKAAGFGELSMLAGSRGALGTVSATFAMSR